nr:immunoglobulin heavy chain junction region [Mus musculus]
CAIEGWDYPWFASW